jgi:small subunit ribosomal protein S8
MVNDPIADFLTRIRNALLARKKEVVTNCSKMTTHLAAILEKSGYVEGIEFEKDGVRKSMRIGLRYDAKGKPIAEGFKRISKPGLRNYSKASDIPQVRGGLGIVIVSTSRGVMTSVEAKKLNVGGEVLCSVW